jgi:hypothetical protein
MRLASSPQRWARHSMLRKIGFRRLLPVLSLALYVASICVGNAGRSGTTHISATRTHTAEVGTIPARVKMAVSLNVPAVLAASLLNAIVFHFQTSGVFLLAVPFVPVLWYPVGKWFDRRLGWVHRCKPKRTFIRDTLVVASGVLAILSVVVFAQVIKRGYPGPPDTFWIAFGVCAWFAFLLVVVAGIFHAHFLQKHEVATSMANP